MAKAPPVEELATLAGKLAAGTAPKEHKARLRMLAAKVRDRKLTICQN